MGGGTQQGHQGEMRREHSSVTVAADHAAPHRTGRLQDNAHPGHPDITFQKHPRSEDLQLVNLRLWEENSSGAHRLGKEARAERTFVGIFLFFF